MIGDSAMAVAVALHTLASTLLALVIVILCKCLSYFSHSDYGSAERTSDARRHASFPLHYYWKGLLLYLILPKPAYLMLTLACTGVVAEIAEVGKPPTHNAQLPAPPLNECESDSSGCDAPLLPRLPLSRLRKAALLELALAAGIPEAELQGMTVPVLRERLRRGAPRWRPTVAVATASQTPACPLCTSVMVAKMNQETGQRFLGCSLFPDCRGTRRMVAGK